MGRSAAKRSIKIKAADRSPPAVTFETDATPQRLAMVASRAEEALRMKGERMAKVRRLVPPIDTLLANDKITRDEHAALTYYRDQAHTAEKSPVRDSLDKSVRGGSGEFGLPAAIISAVLATSRMERDMGSVADIARFIAVDDRSVNEWCRRKYGERERYDGKGRFVCMVPLREVESVKLAILELRMAARRIVR